MLDKKIVIVVRHDLLDWQKLNVVAFLASAVAIEYPEVHGTALINGSGSRYLPFVKQPILIFKADSDQELKRALQRAEDRELTTGIYTAPLFATRSEAENHIEMAKASNETQDIVGLVVYGQKSKVDKSLRGLSFHP